MDYKLFFIFCWWILRERKRMTVSKGKGVKALQRLADGLGVEWSSPQQANTSNPKHNGY